MSLTIIKQSVILFGREINYVMLCYVITFILLRQIETGKFVQQIWRATPFFMDNGHLCFIVAVVSLKTKYQVSQGGDEASWTPVNLYLCM